MGVLRAVQESGQVALISPRLAGTEADRTGGDTEHRRDGEDNTGPEREDTEHTIVLF